MTAGGCKTLPSHTGAAAAEAESDEAREEQIVEDGTSFEAEPSFVPAGFLAIFVGFFFAGIETNETSVEAEEAHAAVEAEETIVETQETAVETQETADKPASQLPERAGMQIL